MSKAGEYLRGTKRLAIIQKYKVSSRGGKLILIANKKDSVNDRCTELLNNVVNELK